MKLLTLEQFLAAPTPTVYIRYSDYQLYQNGLGLEVKKEVIYDEDYNAISWKYAPLWDLQSPFNDGSKQEQELALEANESIPNCVKIEKNYIPEESFIVFEMEDMQSLIIPLAECFDALANNISDKDIN